MLPPGGKRANEFAEDIFSKLPVQFGRELIKDLRHLYRLPPSVDPVVQLSVKDIINSIHSALQDQYRVEKLAEPRKRGRPIWEEIPGRQLIKRSKEGENLSMPNRRISPGEMSKFISDYQFIQFIDSKFDSKFDPGSYQGGSHLDTGKFQLVGFTDQSEYDKFVKSLDGSGVHNRPFIKRPMSKNW